MTATCTLARIRGLMLAYGCSLLFLQAPASANLLYTSYTCGSNSTSKTAESGPLNVAFACGGSISATGSLTVNYTPSGQGSLIDFLGGGEVVGTTHSIDSGPMGNGLQITSSTLPVGTPIALTVDTVLSGTYSYSTANGVVADVVTGTIALSGTPTVTYENSTLYFCPPGYVGSCDAGEGTISASGSGSLSVPIVSSTLDTTIGASGISLVLLEQQELDFQGSFHGNFLDPFILTNVQVTDPTTGALLSGVTVTGDAGSYPVNVASTVPEPSSFALVAVMLTGILIIRTAAGRARGGQV